MPHTSIVPPDVRRAAHPSVAVEAVGPVVAGQDPQARPRCTRSRPRLQAGVGQEPAPHARSPMRRGRRTARGPLPSPRHRGHRRTRGHGVRGRPPVVTNPQRTPSRYGHQPSAAVAPGVVGRRRRSGPCDPRGAGPRGTASGSSPRYPACHERTWTPATSAASSGRAGRSSQHEGILAATRRAASARHKKPLTVARSNT